MPPKTHGGLIFLSASTGGSLDGSHRVVGVFKSGRDGGDVFGDRRPFGKAEILWVKRGGFL